MRAVAEAHRAKIVVDESDNQVVFQLRLRVGVTYASEQQPMGQVRFAPLAGAGVSIEQRQTYRDLKCIQCKPTGRRELTTIDARPNVRKLDPRQRVKSTWEDILLPRLSIQPLWQATIAFVWQDG